MKLKISSVVLLAGLILTGCMAPYEAMRANNYSKVQPEPPPPEILGAWTGTSGPYLVTIKLGPDGRGLLCASWHANESVNNVKYFGGALYLPDGMRIAVGAEGGQLVGQYDQRGMEPIRFYPDLKLVEASPYCKEKLR